MFDMTKNILEQKFSAIATKWVSEKQIRNSHSVLKNINSIKMKFLFGLLATAQVNCQTLMDTPPELLAMMIMDPTTHAEYMAMPSADQVFNMETGEILDSFMNPEEEEHEEEHEPPSEAEERLHCAFGTYFTGIG